MRDGGQEYVLAEFMSPLEEGDLLLVHTKTKWCCSMEESHYSWDGPCHAIEGEYVKDLGRGSSHECVSHK